MTPQAQVTLYLAVAGVATGFLGGTVALLALVPPILRVLYASAPTMRSIEARRRFRLLVRGLALVALLSDMAAVLAVTGALLTLALPALAVAALGCAILALVTALPILVLLSRNALMPGTPTDGQ